MQSPASNEHICQSLPLALHLTIFRAGRSACATAEAWSDVNIEGRGSLGSTAWLGLALWAVILIGQVQLVQQSTLALLCWASLFCLPLLYLQCRRALDTLVEESLFFVSQVCCFSDIGRMCWTRSNMNHWRFFATPCLHLLADCKSMIITLE